MSTNIAPVTLACAFYYHHIVKILQLHILRNKEWHETWCWDEASNGDGKMKVANHRAMESEHRPRILIAEDESEMRFTLSIMLKRKGYAVKTVTDGVEALDELIKAGHSFLPYDLFITDINMPRMNGERILTELAEKGMKQMTLVITGFGDKETVKRLMRLGCSAFLDKPFEPARFEAEVNRLLALAEQDGRQGGQEGGQVAGCRQGDVGPRVGPGGENVEVKAVEQIEGE
ncbi:MAG: response regulator [Lentisphaerota bacterium]